MPRTLAGRLAHSALALGALLGAPACTESPVAYNPQPPEAAIVEPTDGTGIPEFAVGATVTFVATVQDDVTPVEDLEISWQSTHTADGAQVTEDLGGSPADTSGRATLNATGLVEGVHTIRVGVEDGDGLTAYDYVDVAIVEPNAPPTVTIASPDDGEVFDQHDEIDFIGSADDDRGAEALSVSWNSDIDGQLDSEPPGADGLMAFAWSDLAPGEHTITVTVTDGGGLQAVDQVVITVIPENRAPTPPAVFIDPPGPGDGDDLACQAAGSVDPEGGTVVYTYSWLKEGASYAWGDPTLPASHTSRGETWTCVAVAADEQGLESDPGQASVTIDNSAPSFTSVTLTPSTAYETSVLTCTPYGWSDPDGYPQGQRFEWWVSGALLGAAGSTLAGADFDHFDEVQCVVYPTDGTVEGAPVSSGVVTIENTPPGAPALAVEPSPPHPGDDLACVVVSPGADPDPDGQTYEYEWYRDGVLQASLTSDAVSGALVALGAEWSCQARALDGYVAGPWGEASELVVPRVGDLVVTEVMVDPATVSDSAGEYVEVYNAADYAISLSGWVLGDGLSESHTLASAPTLAPGDVVVLARNASEASNGGFEGDYQYTGLTLDNESDGVVLSFAGVVVDEVRYRDDLGFTVPAGAALTLDPGSYDAAANDAGSAWCRATTPIVSGGDFGTPGRANDDCACAASDGDGDGFGDAPECAAAWIDCDDAVAAVHPGAAETCGDGIDQDCSGADRSCTCAESDLDGDGYGTVAACAQLDCDDSNATVHPGGTEVCDGLDQDCDGVADDGFDVDGDGWTTCGGDCNDGNPAAHPGLVETCNGFDDDCNGTYDLEGSSGCTPYYADGDEDGYGIGSARCLCGPSSPYTALAAGDCNDANAAVRPGAVETCDLADQDCDGVVDDVGDGDGDGYTTCAGDCDDTRADVSPGDPETCGAADEDCDGTINEDNASGCTNYYYDQDGDGYGTSSYRCMCSTNGNYRATSTGDCYDSNSNAKPGQTSWFTSHRGDGSHDYDCNGSQQQRYTSYASWDCYDVWGVDIYCEDFNSEGWKSSIPGCGSSGSWGFACAAFYDFCDIDTYSRSQECR
ncbi:lamin tail domain-containing protein [Myxococcota bacterium]|nr:lamin tail domain-containing protein [Myxococcota bacterium]